MRICTDSVLIKSIPQVLFGKCAINLSEDILMRKRHNKVCWDQTQINLVCLYLIKFAEWPVSTQNMQNYAKYNSEQECNMQNTATIAHCCTYRRKLLRTETLLHTNLYKKLTQIAETGWIRKVYSPPHLIVLTNSGGNLEKNCKWKIYIKYFKKSKISKFKINQPTPNPLRYMNTILLGVFCKKKIAKYYRLLSNSDFLVQYSVHDFRSIKMFPSGSPFFARITISKAIISDQIDLKVVEYL